MLFIAHGSAEHEATSYSSARLVCGRELQLPLDLVTGRPPDEGMPISVSPYVAVLQDRLRDVHHQVRENGGRGPE